MSYRKIDPRLWDDDRFVDLSTVEKLLWLYVLTGPHTTSLPGLWVVGIGELVDGLRLPEKCLRPALGRLEGDGLLTYSPSARLIRVPNAPKYNRPENARVLKAWFNQWVKIPECQQKYDHLLSLWDAVSLPPEDSNDVYARGETIIAQWRASFDVAVVPGKYSGVSRDPTLPRPASLRSSRTVRELVANSSTAPAFVPCSDLSSGISDLDPSSSLDPENLPEIAHARSEQRASEVGRILDLLRKLPGCARLANERQAALFAARIVHGAATLEGVLGALTDGAYKAESEEAQGRHRAPPELAAYLMGCVGRAGRETAVAAPLRRSGGPSAPGQGKPAFAPLQAGEKTWSPDDSQ